MAMQFTNHCPLIADHYFAKRRQPPSRRRPSRFSAIQDIMSAKNLQHHGRRLRGICLFRVFCGLKFSYYYRSFSCFLTTIFSMRFSVARSVFTTAAAAGAVCIILNQRLVSSLNPQDDVGPAARLFSVFSVFCGLKFRA
ncbi:MAG: hypothetical protein IKN52_09595, partial [Victivallales bacterium]|nr:hypothetical protein [Victivallales bacterium]